MYVGNDDDNASSDNAAPLAAKRRRSMESDDQVKLRDLTGFSTVPLEEGSCGFIIDCSKAKEGGSGYGQRLRKHLEMWHPTVISQPSSNMTRGSSANSSASAASTSTASAPSSSTNVLNACVLPVHSQSNSTILHHFKMVIDMTPSNFKEDILRLVCDDG